MKGKLKTFIGILTVLAFLGIALVGGVNYYLNSEKHKIFPTLKEGTLGSIEFKRANFDILRSFPYATLKLRFAVAKDSLFDSHKAALFEAQKVDIRFYLRPLLQGKLELKNISVYNGQLELLTLPNGYNNLKSLVSALTPTKDSTKSSLFSISKNELTLSLEKFHVISDNRTTNQRVAGLIEHFTTDLLFKGDSLISEVDMQIAMEEMTLNPEKGSFFKNASVGGKFSSKIKLDSQQVFISPFDLQVNDQVFRTQIFFQTSGHRPFVFELQNEATQFRNSINLLNDRIQEELIHYDILAPFASHTFIRGRLVRGNNALVEIDYHIQDAPIGIWEYQLDSVDMVGHFANRIYGDTISLDQTRKHFRIEIDSAEGYFGGIHLETEDALFTKKQPDTASFQIDIQGKGLPRQLSDLLENEKFIFNKGNFGLDLSYEGKYDGMEDVLTGSHAVLQLSDFEVSYTPIKVSFPIRKLLLDKAAGDSKFEIRSNTFSQKNEFVIAGGLNNFPNLIFERIPGATSSSATITANKLSWEDFLDLFGKQGILASSSSNTGTLLEKTGTLKQFISGLYDSFQPNIDIAIDTFVYSDNFEVLNFRSSLLYRDVHTLVLENTHFDYKEGHLAMSLVLDLEDPTYTPFQLCLETEQVNLKKLLPPFDYFDIQYFKQNKRLPENVSLKISHEGVLHDHVGLVPNSSVGEINFSLNNGESAFGKIVYEPVQTLQTEDSVSESLINTRIQIEGDPQIISDLFNNEKFFFRGGDFDVDVSYSGDVEDLNELLKESVSKLRVRNTEIYYKPVDITFPIRSLAFDMKDEVAAFDLNMYSDSLQQEVGIQGNLTNFSTLVIKENTDPVSTEVEISSPHLSWNKFLGFFVGVSPDTTQREIVALKKTLTNIYKTFNPTLELSVDTFTYHDKLQFREISSRVRLDDFSNLVLDDTGLKYEDGEATLNASFDLKDAYITPFYLNFKTQKIDLAKFMDSFDYFNVSTFRNIEKMAGKVSLNGEFIGTVKDSVGLVPDDSRGTLEFLVEDAQVKGFERLKDLAAKAKVFKRSRFDNIYFAPISNKVSIKGNRIEIPQMEIQSTAFSMFVEGTFSYQDSTSMWVAIPLDNIKRRATDTPPPKIGYENAGRKIYVEVYTDEYQNDQFRFRLNNKKFYEQRGILDQFKSDKKENRKSRKSYKRTQRKNKSPI